MATDSGHFNQRRQHLQSTSTTNKIQERMKKIIEDAPKGKPFKKILEEDIEKNVFLPSDLPNIKTHQLIFPIIESSHAGIGYIDLAGQFSFRSSRGNEYILVAYHYNVNDILAEPLRNRQAETITEVWKKINKRCASAGIQPYTYIMDNEASNRLKKASAKKEISHQLVPPRCHRANLSERAIHTFNNHLKVGLATTGPEFPTAEWDRIIPQAKVTLSLLRATRVNPKLSACAYIFG